MSCIEKLANTIFQCEQRPKGLSRSDTPIFDHENKICIWNGCSFSVFIAFPQHLISVYASTKFIHAMMNNCSFGSSFGLSRSHLYRARSIAMLIHTYYERWTTKKLLSPETNIRNERKKSLHVWTWSLSLASWILYWVYFSLFFFCCRKHWRFFFIVTNKNVKEFQNEYCCKSFSFQDANCHCNLVVCVCFCECTLL